MGKVIAYIATSLNGYIAGEDDDVSWLEAYNVPGEDHGYSEFIKHVGTAIMGARTYEQSLKHPERMLTGIKNYVLSHKVMAVPQGIDAEFYHGDIGSLIKKIRTESNKDIFVVGGGKLISSFIKEKHLDELLHFIAPVLLEKGLPLYEDISKKTNLHLIEAKAYKTGIVKLHYNLTT